MDGGMVQVIECHPKKHEALYSSPTTKKKKKASAQQRKQLPESADNLQNRRKSLQAIHQMD
jgi:uncharacterized protein (DUF3084 family)